MGDTVAKGEYIAENEAGSRGVIPTSGSLRLDQVVVEIFTRH